jgi:predicted DNA-binding ribbon-helix-helix protein
VASTIRAATPREISIVRRAVVIRNHRKGISLEDAFWNMLDEIAAHRCISVDALVRQIDAECQYQPLASAIRLFVLAHVRSRRAGYH